MATASGSDVVYALVRNIPRSFHSVDLRNYFSQFVEEGVFLCFHYQHRPELPSSKAGECCRASSCCSVVRVLARHLDRLIKAYDGRHWIDKKEQYQSSLCRISKVRLHPEEAAESSSASSSVGASRSSHFLSPSDLSALPELRPPTVLPQGNVGTPTKTLVCLINQCKIPAKLIGQLGLTFPRRRSNRRYGNVPFDYGRRKHRPEEEGPDEEEGDEETVTTGSGTHVLSDEQLSAVRDVEKAVETRESHRERERQEEHSGTDEDDCEEWERHEAFHDDVDKQGRTSPYLFEKEMDVQWEKGGSGLVFYTDESFWAEQKGTDFDDDTADDWDVDVSVYYQPGGGDFDSRQLLTMAREKRLREGSLQEGSTVNGVARFERYTKGVGSRLLRSMGWKQGEGVGGWKKGRVSPVPSDGQQPSDKRGLGYRGPTRDRNAAPRKPASTSADTPFRISTAYDARDPEQPVLRRWGPHWLKQRDKTAKPDRPG